MSKENEIKRPPMWRPMARARYDAAMQTAMLTLGELKARVLPKEIAEEFDFDVPPQWTEQPALYLLRGLGYGSRGLPEGSGFGLVQSPYADVYTKVYGVNPISDLPKYRKMYRSQPDIQQAVQMQVNLAVGKGFTISHESEEVIDYLNDMIQRLDLMQHMLVMATDCLVYGNSYTEIQWDKTVKTTMPMYEYKGENYSKDDLNSLNIPLNKVKPAIIEDNGTKKNFVADRMGRAPDAKTIVALKDLDPLYMRVRRDSYGNQYGYIQWMAFPPVLIDNESCIHCRYRPASWGYESAYGNSVLMPIIKNNELLMQFENDAATWIHSRAVPPLIVKGGTPEKPYSTGQMGDLMNALKTRSAATMIFTKGDVSMEEFKTMASELRLEWWVDFLLLRRYQSLGVPPIMMGYTYRTSRGIAEVVLHDFVTRLQVLQEFIADPIEKYIFEPLIKMKFGDKTENAHIVWKPIIEEDKNMRSQRLIQMMQAGAVSVNECREEMGFRSMQDKKYDELISKEPGTQPSGFPPKPGGAIKAPEQNRVRQQSKKPPESHMKLEDLKTKKIQLLKLEENFREKMLGLTQKTKFDLKDDAKLVKDVKREARDAAKELINENIVSSYLMGRMNANTALGNEDDLSLKQEDLEPLSELKTETIKSFDKILDEMVKMKENGELE
jgi:hypothetical protein